MTVTAILFCVVLTLCACGKKDKKISVKEKTVYYSDSDFEQAKAVINAEMELDFSDCVLDELEYMGDNYSVAFQNIADDMGCDEVMVIRSTFHSKNVDYSLPEKGDESTVSGNESTPDGVWDNWRWIMVRKLGGEWMIGQCGPIE